MLEKQEIKRYGRSLSRETRKRLGLGKKDYVPHERSLLDLTSKINFADFETK